jgi:N-methylhydantoinase A/oxoprolinase/acetone carboxylase beta subunit
VLDGEPLTESGGEIAGVPIALPRVLVETVSAGGGSIGWIDDGGALRVGPRSAGATPGPAAFGRGGSDATVTDAQIVLGALTARAIGVVALDAEAAHAAVGRLAAALGVAPERTARAMVQAADAAMARALRRVSVERGIDPRRCTLVAFGGGGPLHACALADHLGIRTVLVPPFAGVLSALGLAIAPERRDALASVMRPAHALTAADTRELDAVLAARAGRSVVALGATQRWLRARYFGQGHELEIPFAPGEEGASLTTRFAAEHQKRMGFALEQEVEIVGARIAISGAAREAALAPPHFADLTRAGPAVIPLSDATLFVADGWTARALPIGGYLLERIA